MKKTKLLITATIVATVLTATACGGKNQASTPTVVKQVNSTSTEKATDKQEVTEASVENTASSNEEVLVAEAVTEENQGNSDSIEEINNTVPEEQPAEDINAAWTDTTPAEQPEENTNSGWEDAAPVEQPAEAPVEDSNVGIVDTTPEEQPAAPAEPSPAPSPAPAPEPVVTPQEPAKPSVTEEQQLVATGKWTKIMEWNDGADCRVYEYKDDITGYSVRASFADGEFYLEQWNSLEEEKAIYSAHGITDNVVSFDRLMKLSNS